MPSADIRFLGGGAASSSESERVRSTQAGSFFFFSGEVFSSVTFTSSAGRGGGMNICGDKVLFLARGVETINMIQITSTIVSCQIEAEAVPTSNMHTNDGVGCKKADNVHATRHVYHFTKYGDVLWADKRLTLGSPQLTSLKVMAKSELESHYQVWANNPTTTNHHEEMYI